MDVPAEKLHADRGTLEYAPVHHGRRIRWTRWLILAIICIVGLWAYRFAPVVLHNVWLDLEIRRCMNVTLPKDGVALDATFKADGTIITRASLDVPELTALRKLRGGVIPDASIFVGRMTTKSGVRKLVVVQVLHNRPSEPMMLVTRTIVPASWAVLSDAKFESSTHIFPSLNPAARPLDVLAMVGTIDATDPSHLSFAVRVNDQPRVFDFWLRDGKERDVLEERATQAP